MKTDVGLVQLDPFQFNHMDTIAQLRIFLRGDREQDDAIRKRMSQSNAVHVVADVSPLGLRMAESIGLKSTLVENFTWDWIYEPFAEIHQEYEPICDRIRQINSSANLRIQVEPFGKPRKHSAKARPVHREFRTDPAVIRKQMGISPSEDFTLICTGGIAYEYAFIDLLKESEGNYLLCGSFHKLQKSNNIVYLPMDSPFHFPDLIRASSRVIGKAGYGTTVECWAAHKRFYAIFRDDFRESEVLKEFITKENLGEEMKLKNFQAGSWIDRLPPLDQDSSILQTKPNGNHFVASQILKSIEAN